MQNIKSHRGGIDNTNMPISIRGIDQKINNLPKKTAPSLDGFIDETHQTFQEEMIPILQNLFQRIEVDRMYH